MLTPPRDELTEEEHLPVDLSCRDIEVLDASKATLQIIQLMVVCREEGLRSPMGIVMEILDDRPCNRNPVIRTGTTPEFIEEDERLRRDSIKDA